MPLKTRKSLKKSWEAWQSSLSVFSPSLKSQKNIYQSSLQMTLWDLILKAHEKRSSRFATQNIDQAFDSKVNIGKQKTPKLEQDGGGSIRNQRVRTTF